MVQYNVPNCFSGDCDCQGTPSGGTICPYGDCFECTPSECDGPKCCCCSSIDIVLDIRSRCYDRVFYSCNIDGTSFGPGLDPFPPGCPQCFDACDRALGGTEACASISQHVDNPMWQPSPPTWFDFPLAYGPCECNCADFVDPSNPEVGCDLTCVTCAGLQCGANVEVLAGSCSYQFNLTPSTGCCGTPALVDVVFVIDYSVSMDPYINSVINDVGDLADQLSVTGGQARFGLIVYGKGQNDVTINYFGSEILTENVDDFKAKLSSNLPTSGGAGPDFDAVETALVTYPWSGVENLIFLIGDEPVDSGNAYPIEGDFGNPTGQPSAAMLIELANSLGAVVNVAQEPSGNLHDTRKTDLAIGTNGEDLDIATSFADVVDSLNLNIFGASCDCLDSTPIPVQLCTGGTGASGDECIDPDPDVPIRKCVNKDNSDCMCNAPLSFDVCGEIVTVVPDEATTNLVCCGDIEGGGCSCPTDPICSEQCCGVECLDLDICSGFRNVQDAIDHVWCECLSQEIVIETENCSPSKCVFDSDDPDYADLINCTIKLCDGQGGYVTKTRHEVVAEVEAAWANCVGSIATPPPPSISEASCLPECDRQDECVVGDLTCNDVDIRNCRQDICSNPSADCTSTRNPATTILNNGIGLVAYESMSDNSVIKIDQFNTSLPAKILPNRKTNYGRLQHELRWEDGQASGTKIAKLYYYSGISSHFMNGVLGIPSEGSLKDIVVFQTGPFQNQCFSLHETPIEEDDVGAFIQFTVSTGYVLSSAFPSVDDVYDIEWFILDSDDTGLTGSSTETTETPGSDFLLDSTNVDSVLSLSPHIHDGAPVPVANPSITTAHNYMNSVENSHFVYLAYQALENSKWNLYMRQLRLSEYSREDIVDTATPVSLTSLGVNDLNYRVVCTTDDCSIFGNDFLAKRTVTMEIALQDGRDVFNQNLLSSVDSWTICPGAAAGSYSKKRVYAELVHSAIVNKCPDQFAFNDLFFDWEVGDEFTVPYAALTAEQLFVLMRKPNDSSMEVTEENQTISGIQITSSQVGVVWYDDPTLDTWVTSDEVTFQEMLQFKGLDVSEPIPITDFETGHCTHPVIKANTNNDVFVVYECTDPLLHQIHITGTAMPSSSLPLGIFTPRNIDTTLDYFFAPKDFAYRDNVTTSGEGINQLPDMHIDQNDVLHIAWQSSRNNYWEIYYANSDEQFRSKRITDFKSKSLKPSIIGDVRGNLHIAWHDNRFGNWEILMAYRDDERIETLFEQDPYLAGARNEGYSHSTDVIPLTLNNISSTDPLCISNLTIRFFNDRTRTLAAFDVLQSEFPIAFQIPGTEEVDSAEITIVYPRLANDFQEQLTLIGFSPTTIRVYDPVDTGLSLQLKSFTITYGAGYQPRDIRFGAGETPELAQNAHINLFEALGEVGEQVPNSVATSWIDVQSITSGEEVFMSDAVHNSAHLQAAGVEDGLNIPTVFGRYIRVEISRAAYADELVEIKLNLERPGRVCLGPGETVTGFLDLTPSIRVDKLGNEVIETPLPIEARTNKAYFISVLGINDSGQLVVFEDPKRSVSCESCTGISAPWDSAACTFTVTFSNFNSDPVAKTKFFNARVRFYTDSGKVNLIAQFDAFADAEGNLDCFTTDDNRPAQNVWNDEGLEILHGQQRTVTLWPMLSNTTGLLCGIKYWVEIKTCEGTANSPCYRTDLEAIDLVSWTCDCASPRWSAQFGEAPVNIRELVRWKSSGDGFADTRLTETGSVNNFNPVIRMRSDLTGLVLYESNRDDPNRFNSENEVHTLYTTAFTIFPTATMYASGAEVITSSPGDLLVHSDIPITACSGTNCDDDGPAMEGRNVAFSLDQYDNIFLAAERQYDQSKCEEAIENKQQSIIVHRCGARAVNLNFTPEEQEGAGVFACSGEDVLGKTAPLITDKTFKKIIKLARVNNKFAAYHITRSKKPAAVVEQCDVVMDIITEPDTMAVRLRNENEPWSNWYPFDPEKGDYTVSIPWSLSAVSGIKNVTIEAATYQGLSASATVTIVADYKGVDHSMKFYRLNNPDAPVPGFAEISNTELLSRITDNQDAFDESNILPTLEGLPVAGIRHPTVEGSDDDAVIVNQTGEFIFIEIIPPLEYLLSLDLTNDKNFPTFDVLQQGDDDLFSMPTLYDSVKKVFQGTFPVRKDNTTFYRDGLSFVIPHFRNDCSDVSSGASAVTQYTKDQFNQPIPGGQSPDSIISTDDVWEDERDEAGRIKNSFDIRGTEDPYFVFGDPNYRLKKQDE